MEKGCGIFAVQLLTKEEEVYADMGMDYISMHVRVENAEKVFDEIKNKDQDNIAIFPESYLRDVEIKNRSDELLKKLVVN